MRGCMRATAFGAVIAASLALAVPTASAEGCASTCSVGAVGTGGENSDGQASGFRLAGPSRFPDSTFTNQGNVLYGGHISIEGASNGSASGNTSPQGDLVGHFEGVSADFFGTPDPCSGICG
jgi:hypothetical protein